MDRMDVHGYARKLERQLSLLREAEDLGDAGNHHAHNIGKYVWIVLTKSALASISYKAIIVSRKK